MSLETKSLIDSFNSLKDSVDITNQSLQETSSITTQQANALNEMQGYLRGLQVEIRNFNNNFGRISSSLEQLVQSNQSLLEATRTATTLARESNIISARNALSSSSQGNSSATAQHLELMTGIKQLVGMLAVGSILNRVNQQSDRAFETDKQMWETYTRFNISDRDAFQMNRQAGERWGFNVTEVANAQKIYSSQGGYADEKTMNGIQEMIRAWGGSLSETANFAGVAQKTGIIKDGDMEKLQTIFTNAINKSDMVGRESEMMGILTGISQQFYANGYGNETSKIQQEIAAVVKLQEKNPELKGEAAKNMMQGIDNFNKSGALDALVIATNPEYQGVEGALRMKIDKESGAANYFDKTMASAHTLGLSGRDFLKALMDSGSNLTGHQLNILRRVYATGETLSASEKTLFEEPKKDTSTFDNSASADRLKAETQLNNTTLELVQSVSDAKGWIKKTLIETLGEKGTAAVVEFTKALGGVSALPSIMGSVITAIGGGTLLRGAGKLIFKGAEKLGGGALLGGLGKIFTKEVAEEGAEQATKTLGKSGAEVATKAIGKEVAEEGAEQATKGLLGAIFKGGAKIAGKAIPVLADIGFGAYEAYDEYKKGNMKGVIRELAGGVGGAIGSVVGLVGGPAGSVVGSLAGEHGAEALADWLLGDDEDTNDKQTNKESETEKSTTKESKVDKSHIKESILDKATIKQLIVDSLTVKSANGLTGGTTSGNSTQSTTTHTDKGGEQISTAFMDARTHDLGNFGNITAEDINRIIADHVGEESEFYGQGQIFVDAAKESGLDPRYILAHAAIESGWGTSELAHDRANYFGIGAFDIDPDLAYKMGGNLRSGIINGAKWIKSEYYDEGQKSLYNMRWNNGSHQYATDTRWDTSIGEIYARGIELTGGISPSARVPLAQSLPTVNTQSGTTSPSSSEIDKENLELYHRKIPYQKIQSIIDDRELQGISKEKLYGKLDTNQLNKSPIQDKTLQARLDKQSADTKAQVDSTKALIDNTQKLVELQEKNNNLTSENLAVNKENAKKKIPYQKVNSSNEFQQLQRTKPMAKKTAQV